MTIAIRPRAFPPIGRMPWAILLSALGPLAHAVTFDVVTRTAEALARAPYRAAGGRPGTRRPEL
jgi:hypothetical protein